MACKGTCSRYKAEIHYGDRHYELGHKRCSTCEIFINWDGIHCPCCNFTLRTRPKGKSGRHQLLLVRQSKRSNGSTA